MNASARAATIAPNEPFIGIHGACGHRKSLPDPLRRLRTMADRPDPVLASDETCGTGASPNPHLT
jgi:hypothetical protein